ncbi:hypothetical protein [Streptomyces violarus]|uniref:hypothetical protein n=1 Tax=Streptomyces violarus TaxID=67380 RepID=UPI0021C1C951|nr:hypothetical protein [Streptomyces violarus]MCT9137964.1 hypothetical protein [Streptomyces violarus]
MITSTVRRMVVAALTTTFAVLPAPAHAEGKDADNDIERVELIGISRSDTRPAHVMAGDDWMTRLDLHTPATDGSGKKTLKPAGEGHSDCSAVKVQGDEVTAQCTRVLRLEKGTLVLSDMITYRPGKRVTAKTGITAGTGQYRSAYGEGYITLEDRQVRLVLNIDE